MEIQGTNMPCIDIASLPDTTVAEMNFLDTSFFKSREPFPVPLPTPDEVKQKCAVILRGGSGVVRFEHLGLIVKAGNSKYVRLEEAQTMWAIKRAFPGNEVPVPEVFGWRKAGHQNFIYMSLVPGSTLRDAWELCTTTDKEAIREQLASIVGALRRLTQDCGPPNRFVGSVNKGPLQDRLFQGDYEEGPFWGIEAFNDFTGAAVTKQRPGPGGIVKNIYRDFFPDSGNIYFTHGDLTLTNIMVSGEPGTMRIIGIIDWEQAGWYPEYWEYCKMLIAVDYEHEWRSEGWADGVMRPFEDAFEAYGEYYHWRGCP